MTPALLRTMDPRSTCAPATCQSPATSRPVLSPISNASRQPAADDDAAFVKCTMRAQDDMDALDSLQPALPAPEHIAATAVNAQQQDIAYAYEVSTRAAGDDMLQGDVGNSQLSPLTQRPATIDTEMLQDRMDDAGLAMRPRPGQGRRSCCILLSPEQQPCHSEPVVEVQHATAASEASEEARVSRRSPSDIRAPPSSGDRLREDVGDSGPQTWQPDMPPLTGLDGHNQQVLGQGSRACSQAPAEDLPLAGAASQMPADVSQEHGRCTDRPDAVQLPDGEAQSVAPTGKLLALVLAELSGRSELAVALPEWLAELLRRFPDCLLGPRKTGEVSEPILWLDQTVRFLGERAV